MAEQKKPVRHDELVQRLAPIAHELAELTMITGLVGKGAAEGFLRIYTAPDLREYLEIAETAIHHHEPMEGAGSRIWLKEGAQVKHVVTNTLEAQGGFLQGKLAAANLAAAGTAGGMVDPRVSTAMPPSMVNCPSVSTACPTWPAVCGLITSTAPVICRPYSGFICQLTITQITTSPYVNPTPEANYGGLANAGMNMAQAAPFVGPTGWFTCPPPTYAPGCVISTVGPRCGGGD